VTVTGELTEDEWRRATGYPYRLYDCDFVFESGDKEPNSGTELLREAKITGCEVSGHEDGVTFYNITLQFRDDKGRTQERRFAHVCPVAASGSNASAEQLKRKFSKSPGVRIATLLCDLEGVVPVFAAHFAHYGSIPASVVSHPGAVSSLFVNLLTPDAMKIMHLTENLGERYRFEALPKGACRRPGLESVQLRYYSSVIGPLRSANDTPIVLSDFKVANCSWPWCGELELMERVFAKLFPRVPLRQVLTSIVRDESERERAAAELKALRIDLPAKRTAEFFVNPTNNRDDSNGRYLVRMSKAAARRSFGRKAPYMVVVSHRHHAIDGVEISCIGWLTIGLEDSSLAGEQNVELDQSIRQALGLDYYTFRSAKASVVPLQKASRWRDRLSQLIGRRLVYCRPRVLQYSDIEKRVVRTPAEALDLLGVKAGDSANLMGVEKLENGDFKLTRARAAALIASTDYIEECRIRRERDRKHRYEDGKVPRPDMTARDPSFAALLEEAADKAGKEQMAESGDINLVFIDQDIRNNLLGGRDSQKYRYPLSGGGEEDQREALKVLYPRTVQCAQPLILYRSPSGAIANEIMTIGITAAALGLNFFVVFRELFDQETWKVWSELVTLGVVGLSFALAFLAAIWKTRAAVR
jgi:hypothetical protein